MSGGRKAASHSKRGGRYNGKCVGFVYEIFTLNNGKPQSEPAVSKDRRVCRSHGVDKIPGFPGIQGVFLCRDRVSERIREAE